MSESSRKVSDSTVRRLSIYLRHLEDFRTEGRATVSSEELARRAGTTSAQIRKDLSNFGSFGKRGLGYTVSGLVDELRGILGLARTWRVVLVGAGRIGSALYEYPDFRRRGFRIVAILDADPEKVGRRWNALTIESADRLEEVCRREGVEIAILAVPGDQAQAVADRLVSAGVRGFLNFAPFQLRMPEGVVVNEVDMAVELEALSFALAAEDRAREES